MKIVIGFFSDDNGHFWASKLSEKQSILAKIEQLISSGETEIEYLMEDYEVSMDKLREANQDHFESLLLGLCQRGFMEIISI